jgi:hypothetical protein
MNIKTLCELKKFILQYTIYDDDIMINFNFNCDTKKFNVEFGGFGTPNCYNREGIFELHPFTKKCPIFIKIT